MSDKQPATDAETPYLNNYMHKEEVDRNQAAIVNINSNQHELMSFKSNIER